MTLRDAVFIALGVFAALPIGPLVLFWIAWRDRGPLTKSKSQPQPHEET
jgi:hypothetical protein